MAEVQLISGTVHAISEPFEYNKKGDEMVTVVLMTPNATQKQRIEYISIDFIKSSMQLVEEKNLQVGDSVQISYQLCGRRWVSPENETKFFGNIQGLAITYK
jgi:hypothetical protein